jgi:hypothetical protein
MPKNPQGFGAAGGMCISTGDYNHDLTSVQIANTIGWTKWLVLRVHTLGEMGHLVSWCGHTCIEATSHFLVLFDHLFRPFIETVYIHKIREWRPVGDFVFESYHHNTLAVFNVFGSKINHHSPWPLKMNHDEPQHPQVAVRYLQSCLPNLEDRRSIRSIRQWKSLSKLVESAAPGSTRNLV